METSFKAFVVQKNKGRSFTYQIEERFLSDLPDNDVLIRVEYSSINFKDIMSAQGHPAITRRFPHTPGLDAVGVVVKSTSDQFQRGDDVMIYCRELGMNVAGGFGQYISVPETWIEKCPQGVSKKDIMAYGTAGFTAALCLEHLMKFFSSVKGLKCVVSGASGGLGSVAISLLTGQGCQVSAITQKENAHEFLKKLGVDEIIHPSELAEVSKQNLGISKWDICIDTVGGEVLSSLLKVMNENGVVCATGMAQNTHFQATVLPFILRGVSLIGINGESTSIETRSAIWQKLAQDWAVKTDHLSRVIRLDDLVETVNDIIEYGPIGRVVIDLGE